MNNIILVFARTVMKFEYIKNVLIHRGYEEYKFVYVSQFQDILGFRECYYIKYYDWFDKYTSKQEYEIDYYLDTHGFEEITI